MRYIRRNLAGPLTEAAKSLSRLTKSISGYSVDAVLVHLEGKGDTTISSVRPGVRAATCQETSKIVLD